MRNSLAVVFLFLSFSLTSCKNEEKQKEEKPVEQKSKTYDIIVDLVIPTDEELILLYKDGSNEWFIEEKTVWVGVKGSDAPQSVVFNLPEGVLPTDIRLDVGRNEFKGLKSLEIKKVTLSYLDNKFEINQYEVNNYFEFNQYMEFNPQTNQYTFKKDEQGNYDPHFLVKPNLYIQLKRVAGLKV